MSEAQVKINERAKLSFDLDDDDAPPPMTKEKIGQKIEEISQKSGFMAKSPKASQANNPVPVSASSRTGRKRALTGRTMPFNTKMRPERYDEICRFCDEFSTEEGRPVGMAEVLERAMDALKAQKKK